MPLNAIHDLSLRFTAITLAILPGLANAGEAPLHKPLTEELALVDLNALKRAVTDLAQSYPETHGAQKETLLAQLTEYDKALTGIRKGVTAKDAESVQRAESLLALKKKILLGNPLLQTFDHILFVRRKITHANLGLPQNWESNSSLPRTGWDNEIATFSLRDPAAPAKTIYKPDGGRFVGDVCLHYDADRVLFSMPGQNRRWQVHELALSPLTTPSPRGQEGKQAAPTELPLIAEPDVDNYDACYLPDGNIIFTSTAPFTGVPCVTGASHVSNLYSLNRATGGIRRLTFDQEHNWNPVVLHNGRVMYLRWEYSDLPHFCSRIVFQMNPDGTNQGEYYGSNSYWPNSTFYMQPIPGQPTMFVGIVSGHHGVPRMGEMILFDPAKGRHEADGVVQRIPGFGQPVKPLISDQLVDDSWPKFLHPWPLSEKYFLVSAKPTPQSAWGLYLVDVFDNMLLLKEEPGTVLFQPIALKKRLTPATIPSRVMEGEKSATMFISDLYRGPGLKDVPRGTVKRLRLITYQFAYHGMGGQVNRVGTDGPWDIKRVLGTVPVEPDGSALFHVPANTPISMQPLDDQGRALARMRSWTTAMPGEFQSCAGCHEQQNTAPLAQTASAAGKTPAEITPWYGPVRGFSFNREVQPVLDRFCVCCHNSATGNPAPNLTLRPMAEDEVRDNTYRKGSLFPPAYQALRCFVRSGPAESDMHTLPPCEFHASTTELVQILEKGHHGVKLDAEAWDRLYTWIDLGAPAHGTWREIVGDNRVENQRQRRLAMLAKYANVDDDAEAIPAVSAARIEPVIPQPPVIPAAVPPSAPGWPFTREEAARRQNALGPATKSVDLGDGVKLELVRIPPGEFVMGDGVEQPLHRVKIERAFWLGRFEVTNAQFARFDPAHDSRLEHGDFLHFSVQARGTPLNGPTQPVCRVSWNQARDYCQWLTERTGSRFDLPTEEQWEYGCRAGTATPFWFGEGDTSFDGHANLADLSFRKNNYMGKGDLPSVIPLWRPAITAVNDGFRASSPVGTFKPNPWGLNDMIGNVWEWTQNPYQTQPLPAGRGSETQSADDRRTVRGGSWSDRPRHATAAAKQGYRPWQVVYNVGFRVMCEE